MPNFGPDAAAEPLARQPRRRRVDVVVDDVHDPALPDESQQVWVCETWLLGPRLNDKVAHALGNRKGERDLIGELGR